MKILLMKSIRLNHTREPGYCIRRPVSVYTTSTPHPHKPHTTHSLRKVMTSTGGTALDMAVKPVG